MKKVIVSQRVNYFSNRNELRDCLDSNFVQFFLKANIQIYPIPNSLINCYKNEFDTKDWIEYLKPDGIVLTGGNDISEFSHRDKMENFLLDFAKLNCLPLLGICKGMLSMGLHDGASIVKIDGHVGHNHKVSGSINGTVNSFHHYAINSCSKNYKVLARSEDGIIEAIVHNSLPWEGWMWHPERETIFNMEHLKRVQTLFSSYE
jgi:gamma-glutamyl-gamma-aminobutyrate hydrolase PuuD